MESRTLEQRPLPAVPLIAGMFFTAVGLLITLDNFDVLNAAVFLRYWPLVLVAAGLAKVVDAGSSRVAATVLVVLGAALLADNIGYIRFDLFDLWPLILIGIGAMFVARSMGKGPGATVSAQGGETSFAMFNERTVRIDSKSYRGGSAAAFLGSLIVDLSDADITSGPAVLHARAMWGAVVIIVPDRWEVIGDVTPFMAAFEMKRRGAADPSRTLIVRGGAMWAGIEVKNASRRS